MSTTSPRQKRKPQAEPVTFEQVAERKLRDNIDRYRGYATRAAGGEFLNEDDLEQVAELLALLRLPDLAWQKHVDALRDFAAAVARQADIEAEQPALEAEQKLLVSEILKMEQELEQKRLRQRNLQSRSVRVVDTMRKQNELRTLYPDVLDTLDNAVAARRRRMQPAEIRQRPAHSEQDGWSS